MMVRRTVTGRAEMLEVTQSVVTHVIVDRACCESIAANAKTAAMWEQCATKPVFIQDCYVYITVPAGTHLAQLLSPRHGGASAFSGRTISTPNSSPAPLTRNQPTTVIVSP